MRNPLFPLPREGTARRWPRRFAAGVALASGLFVAYSLYVVYLATARTSRWKMTPEDRARRERETREAIFQDQREVAAVAERDRIEEFRFRAFHDATRPPGTDPASWAGVLHNTEGRYGIARSLADRGEMVAAFTVLRYNVRAQDPPRARDRDLALYARLADRLGFADEARRARRYVGETGRWRALRETTLAVYERGPFTVNDGDFAESLARAGELVATQVPGRREEVAEYVRRVRALGPNWTGRARPPIAGFDR